MMYNKEKVTLKGFSRMKRAVCLILILSAVLFCGFDVYAQGDASASLQFSKIQLQTGEQLIVSLSINSSQEISEINASVTYDPSLLTFVSADGTSGSNGIISIQISPQRGSTSVSVPLSFTANTKGSCLINVVSCNITDPQGSQIQATVSSGNVEIIEADQTTQTTSQVQTTTNALTESHQTVSSAAKTDANGVPTQGVLVDLQVDKGSLVPPFMYSIHEYSVTVPYEIDKVEIDGKTASKQDHIWYTGNSDCVVGHNVRTITVTDINGQETVYTINIMRLDKEQTPEQTSVYTQQSNRSVTEQSNLQNLSSSKDDHNNIKEILNPALYIVLIVLVVALFIIILWIKNRVSKKDPKKDDEQTKKQRSKIKVSNNKKK